MKLRLLVLLIFFFLVVTGVSAQWELTSLSIGTVDAMISNGTKLFAAASGSSTLLFASTDSGTTWTNSATGILSYNGIKTFAVTNGVIVAGSGAGATNWRSTDDGLTWNEARQGLPSNNGTLFTINQYISRNDTVFASVDNGSNATDVYYSVDSGRIWTGIGFSSVYNARSIISMNGQLYAGTQYNGVFRSSGISAGSNITWTAVSTGLPGSPLKAYVGSLVSIGSTLFASANGIYKTTDQGASWTSANSKGIYGPLYVYGSNLFWSADSFYQSTDLGATWKTLGSLYQVQSIYIFGGYIYAGASGGLYRQRLTGSITGVHDAPEKLPVTYSLSQNYPNPFNPTSSITYQLPVQSFVHLSVFNTLGQEIQTLKNETEQPGIQSVRFDGSSLPSGVYVYRLDATAISDPAKHFTQMRKMMLVK